jgi:hypothetical protein
MSIKFEYGQASYSRVTHTEDEWLGCAAGPHAVEWRGIPNGFDEEGRNLDRVS